MPDARSETQTVTTISLPKKLLEAGRQAARKRQMDFSRFVRMGLVKLCAEEGIELPEEDLVTPPPRGRERPLYEQAIASAQSRHDAPALNESSPITADTKNAKKRAKRAQ